jgi:hypothetical protein
MECPECRTVLVFGEGTRRYETLNDHVCNRILDLSEGLEDTKDGNTIQTFTAKFENGHEADMKVCNGSLPQFGQDGSAPWLDCVLWDPNGNQLGCFVEDGPLEGEYLFVDGEDRYTVIVQSEK